MQQDLKSQFLLDPDVRFLNFGSFGACPRPVFEDYQRWQLLLEREPVQFIAVNGPAYLGESLSHLAKFVHCAADEIAYVTNPSYGLNIVAKSLGLQPGDEVLTTDLEYGASDIAWEHICRKAGAKYVRAHIELPVRSMEEVVAQVTSRISGKTRMVFISHITSSTALKLPAEEICRVAKEKGILTFIDGAHAPAHIELNIPQTHADIYTGACHKWMLAPKGSSFIYIRKELQTKFDPLILSWGFHPEKLSPNFFAEWHMGQGTRDFSAFLAVPAAIKFMEENDWRKVSASCAGMTLKNAETLCEILDAAPLAPLSSDFTGQMFSVQIRTQRPEELQKLLFTKYRVEIPLMRHGDKVYIRYSINAFNTQDDLNHLFAALGEIRRYTSFIEN
jgi:isopenicillin-N epimerase